MAAPPRVRNPQAVLFACGLNSVRSPMAESLLRRMFPQSMYVKSAGVRKGELDPFAVAVMAELGQDIAGHKPITSRNSTIGKGSISTSSSRSRPRRITGRSS